MTEPRLRMYDRIVRLEAAIRAFKEEGVTDLEDALQAIEELRDRQRGKRRA